MEATRIEIVSTHSQVAARTVLGGDGSIASVGSPELAAKFELSWLADDIDGGSMVNYWVTISSATLQRNAEPPGGSVAIR
jgi:hypothetical protein